MAEYKLSYTASEINNKLGSIPTIDTFLSAQGKAADAKAVGDALAQKQPIGNYATESYVNTAIGAIPTPDVSGQINTHNTAADSHSDIRGQISSLSSEIANKQDAISTELWTFTLEDGSVVPKAVYVGEANVAIVTTETNMTTNTNTGMGSFVVSDTISAVGTHILPKGTVLNIGFQNWEDTYSCVSLNGNIVAEAFSEETLSYNYTLNGDITISTYVNANPSSSDPTLPAGHIRYCIIRITEQ